METVLFVKLTHQADLKSILIAREVYMFALHMWLETRQLLQHNFRDGENDYCNTCYSQFPLQQCPYTFLFQAFCSILNRRILKGADSALILVLVVKALGIEETVGYNWLWQLGDDQSPRVEHLKGNLHVSL